MLVFDCDEAGTSAAQLLQWHFLQAKTEFCLKYVLISQGLGRLHFIVSSGFQYFILCCFVLQILKVFLSVCVFTAFMCLCVEWPWFSIWWGSWWISRDSRRLKEMKIIVAQLCCLKRINLCLCLTFYLLLSLAVLFCHGVFYRLHSVWL